MVLNIHISAVRTFLKNFTDDTLYTDQFLANTLVTARNAIYESEFINKKRSFSRFSYSSFCIKLNRESFHDCSCVPEGLGCQVLRSEIDIPKTLIDKQGNLLLTAYTINGKRIDFKEFKKRRLLSSHPVSSRVITFDIIDNRLVIFGNLNLKVIIIEAVWEDPFALYTIPNCDGEGLINGFCSDPTTSEFPMESQIELAVYSLVLKLLGIRTTEDESENAQDNTNRPV